MVTYQVDIKLLEDGIHNKFENWLKKHVNEILLIEGFVSAQVLVPVEGSEGINFSVRYQLKNHQALENYFKNHAGQMREEGLKLFPEQFSASRAVFQEI